MLLRGLPPGDAGPQRIDLLEWEQGLGCRVEGLVCLEGYRHSVSILNTLAAI